MPTYLSGGLMNKLIYYPGFEVTNIEWLKFALLYIDKLCPIIPMSADSHLGEISKRIIDETDLISIHRPDMYEGSKATLDALEYVDKILRTPRRFSTFFGPDIVGRWSQPITQTYTIFEEKYSNEWESYCLENRLGVKCDEGICVHKQLGKIYMTLLAQAIADSRGISPITDDRSLDRYYMIARRPSSILDHKISLAQGTLQLILPKNLSDIGIDKIIKLRNKAVFRRNLKAFHHELDGFLNTIEQESTPTDPVIFVNSLGSAWKDFTDNILVISAGTTVFGLGLWLTISSPTASGIQFVKEVAGGLSLVMGSTVAIKSTWQHTATKRNSRKYLADISTLDYGNQTPKRHTTA